MDRHWVESTARQRVRRNVEISVASLLSTDCEECQKKKIDLMIGLNDRFMDALPEYFVKERIMSAPCTVINGCNIVAISRTFEYTCGHVFISQAKGYMTEDELKDKIIENLAQEFFTYAREKEKDGFVICPYIPLIEYRSVDSMSFETRLGYKSKHGLLKV